MHPGSSCAHMDTIANTLSEGFHRASFLSCLFSVYCHTCSLSCSYCLCWHVFKQTHILVIYYIYNLRVYVVGSKRLKCHYHTSTVYEMYATHALQFFKPKLPLKGNQLAAERCKSSWQTSIRYKEGVRTSLALLYVKSNESEWSKFKSLFMSWMTENLEQHEIPKVPYKWTNE